jgi:type II secretory pathway predicted ATPase ExeA/septal ring-binding cell division protein DamX
VYYTFFGLKQPPFRITPDTDFFFEGGNRGAVLEALIYAITRGEGMVKVTGEVGSGKTMLCRVLQARLPAAVETVYLANPSVSAEEILHAIAFELQLPIPREAGRLEVMHALNEYLLAKHAEGKQVVVFVEESQSMPISTLEEIRLLSNLETRRYKLLQIVLFGQPELDANLRRPEIRQLRERITHSFALTPLDPPSVRDYLVFRLRAAGYHGPDLFSPRVIALMARATGGLTRRINIVADKAMLAAFADNTHNIQPKHVRAAIADSEFSDAGGPRFAWLRRPGWAGAGALALIALAAGVLLEHTLLRPQPPVSGAGQATLAAAPSTKPAAPEAAPEAREATAADPAAAASAAGANATAPAPAPVGPERAPAAPSQGSIAPAALASDSAGPAAAQAPDGAAAPVAAAVQEAGLAPANQPDLLEQRLLATERWLAEANGSVFSIQLLGSTDQEMLRRYLNDLSNYIERDRIFVYRTVANQAPSITVLYGAFLARADAIRSLDGLPPELKANRPYIRTVQGIRSELGLDKPS